MLRTIRLLCAIVTTLVLAVATGGPAAAAADRELPETIPLPNGFRPEGIAIGSGPLAYFGSLANGSIYRANLRTG
ncbi:hypothetical protein AB0K48_60640, partial [Nonomuraea sp. NPDC055795]